MPPNEPPTPGSTEAVEQGCTCPQMDNNYGRGAYKGDFIIDMTCPIHGEEDSPNGVHL